MQSNLFGSSSSNEPKRTSSSRAVPKPALSPTQSISAVPDIDSHTCSTCGRRFDRPSTMRIHANSHTGDKLFAGYRIRAVQISIVTSGGSLAAPEDKGAMQGNSWLLDLFYGNICDVGSDTDNLFDTSDGYLAFST
ncbi:hypothetical protein BKA62DRAFT_776186 [Auriculariales sp. MPI-PUGE-AT-0066]|nr:hypothetical protein BKA62DRAFT_776186 [Auriculariales sp. MPI-PUGE-AT-0066]